MDINVISDIKCFLGEGPYWDDIEKKMVWVDIMNSRIHEYELLSEMNQTFDIGQYIGCVVPGNDSDLLFLGLHNGFASYSRSKRELKMISDPEYGLPNNRFNDGKCDVTGRFWAGTMSMKDIPGQGALYSLEEELSVKKRVTDVSTSNGLTWSNDNKVMYFIDTPTYEIVAFDFDPDTGHITDRRVVVNVPKDAGFPDGMTIDNEGKLWVAHWEGSQVCRWDPDSGEKVTSIDMPVSKPTSCTFGGDNLDQLYVTSARVDLDEEQLRKEPLAGSLFVVNGLGVRGKRVNRFGSGS